MMVSVPDQNQIDFFISYNKSDTHWAEWIAWQLEEAGYHTKIQAWDFRPGNNFVLEMDKAAKEAFQTILVLSDNYLQSHFCPPEWAAAFAQDPDGNKCKIIPIRIQPCSVEGLLSAILHIDLVGLDETKARTAIILGVQEGRAKPSDAPKFPSEKCLKGKLRFPGALPNIWNIPFNRNPNFTGRKEALEQLHNSLKSGNHTALTRSIIGLGGVGKTQLAVEYAYQFAAEYDLVWWIRSDDMVTILADFSSLGDILNLNSEESTEKTPKLQMVKRWLESNERWLLIFDNVQKPEDLYNPSVSEINYIPQSSSGHVLFTSRNPNWSSIASSLNIQVFSSEEAFEFLQKRTGQTNINGSMDLANELGYLPLALEQAAAFIAETPGMTSHKYLQIFRERHRELWENERPPINYPATIATTWSISIEHATENPHSLGVLCICAFLAPEEIPMFLFKKPFSPITDLGLSLIIKNLKKYSLIDATSESISIHRLVQLVTRDNLDTYEKKEWIRIALTLLTNAFTFNPDNPKTWNESALIPPHAVAVVAFAESENANLELAVELIGNVGGYYLRFAEYSQAKVVCERALKISETIFDPNHKDVATAANNLGTVLKYNGEFAEAKKLLERALQINEKLYGPDNERVAAVANNLGTVLKCLGDLSGAKIQHERSIAILQKMDTSKYPDIAKSINNLGLVLHELGKLDKAKEQYEKALKIDLEQYGSIHPEVARDINNIGLILQDLGNYKEAKVKFEQAITINEELFGKEHLEVAVPYNNLGKLLGDMGDLPNAKKQLERTLKIYENAFGPVHPEIARVSNNLGVVLMDMKDLAGAKKAIERALLIDEHYYGPDHIEVGTDVNNLGSIYIDLGDFANAKKQYERALQIGKRAYGSDHLHIATTLNNLGGVNISLKEYSEARKHFQQALIIQEKCLNSQNIEIAKTASNIGNASFFLGDFSEAESQFEKAYKIFIKSVGREHEFSKVTQNNLSMVRGLYRS